MPIVALLGILAFGSGSADPEGENGGVVPVDGFSSTETAPATPTDGPPTHTPVPTDLPTPVTSADCPGLEMINFSTSGDQVSWSIGNFSGGVARIANVRFSYPGDNPPLEVSLGNRVWLNQLEMAALVQEGNSAISEDSQATIPPEKVRLIIIKHKFGPLDGDGYELQLLFEANGGQCLLVTGY